MKLMFHCRDASIRFFCQNTNSMSYRGRVIPTLPAFMETAPCLQKAYRFSFLITLITKFGKNIFCPCVDKSSRKKTCPAKHSLRIWAVVTLSYDILICSTFLGLAAVWSIISRRPTSMAWKCLMKTKSTVWATMR